MENIFVHMDSKLVVDIIQGVIRCLGKVMCPISRIKTIMLDFRRVQVKHVWCEANQPTDFLARWVTISKELNLSPVDFPYELREKIRNDVIQCKYTRM